ncbi:MAG TPA: CbiX/SirB N-terminal domain-containing protein [Verrucomicrobiae bacterium]|nr:CbiX/SirB N-terminal domain-containing protein [Verrucomicrobiae bacterium]
MCATSGLAQERFIAQPELELARPLREASAVSEFRNSALVLIGHGSTVNAASAESVREHARALRALNWFAEVKEIFWKETADLRAEAGAVSASRVFLVPMFAAEGYFSEEKIPQALGFEARRGADWKREREENGKRFIYCKPVGTHPAMAELIAGRARQVLDQFPFPTLPRTSDVSLFIAAHGTERHPASRKAVEEHAASLRASGRFADVQPAFIEEEPRISGCVDSSRTGIVVVAPFFISEGMHAAEDLPVLLGAPARVVRERLSRGQRAWRNPTEMRGKLVWLAESIGTEPSIQEIILSRIKEFLR